MKNSLRTWLLILLTLPAWAQAQKITVTGRTVGAQGEGLPGSTVLERGTTNGTSSGADGEFTISVAPDATLTIQAIGYTAQQVPLNGRTALGNIRLAAAAQDLNEVVVTGSRATEGRSNILTTAPVDVISAREIKAFAQTDVAQILSYVAPSFQSSRQTISDGTDHIDPASLRGLGPDQVLVLVNGKRRHTSSLVNINGTIGRGSVGTDLNVIPTASIKRIEVLRDGAAALYGSDAIAGVINIQLKDDSTGVTASSTLGQTTKSDGAVLQADVNVGIGLNKRGFLDLSGQFQRHDAYNRGFADTAPLIYLGNGGNYPASATTEEARRALKAQDDALVAQRGFDRNDLRIGNAATHNYGGFLNGGYRLGRGYEVYLSGGATYRTGQSAGFNRLPNQATQSDLTLFPNGFLPLINTTIYDQSAILGLRKSFGGFDLDLSNTFGRNELAYRISNSVNASLPQGPGIFNPTTFYAGHLAFAQNTTNLSATRRFSDVGFLPTLNVAAGAEFRYDNFLIGKGEYASYINGGRLVGTTPAAAGVQVFPGYQPQDETNRSRTNVAGYLDLESDVTDKLLVHLAGRAENYSDFGSSVSGQAAARYSILDGLALRGSIGNGFRAPSLQQRYFTNVSTQFVSGLPNQVLTVNNDNPIVRNSFDNSTQKGFGVAPLKQENSTNYSAGLTARVAQAVTLTADAYQINISDRIVLSSQFAKNVPAIATPTIVDQILAGRDVTRVQFFANAVDTRTRGLDIVANYRTSFGAQSRVGLTAAANFNQTKVTGFNSTSSTINGDQTVGTGNLRNLLFDRQQQTRLESGNPRSKINLSANYGYGIFGIEARTVRFGEVKYADANPARAFIDQTFSAKWVTDLTLSAQLLKQVGVIVGVNNLFNVYPDKFKLNPRNDPNNFSVDPNLSFNSTLDNTNRGRFVYNANQFGFQGAFYFARVNVTLP